MGRLQGHKLDLMPYQVPVIEVAAAGRVTECTGTWTIKAARQLVVPINLHSLCALRHSPQKTCGCYERVDAAKRWQMRKNHGSFVASG